ncbi:uncharacterized protein LOC106651328 [Trichogramma pretiosum]|uniref:uncharacterized protein LOC106651328 n=1 Tax=Trichogramma pretiosum TaxID=7493 RepID=UPI0006C9C131|nr:uncharacterized protein LOC106651328 [Trichogramma pretiosum]
MNEKKPRGLSTSDIDYILNGSIVEDRKQKDLAEIETLLRYPNTSGENRIKMNNKVRKRLVMTIRRRSNGIYEIVNSCTEINTKRTSNVKKLLGNIEKFNSFVAPNTHIKNTPLLVRAKAAQPDIRNYYISNNIDPNEYIRMKNDDCIHMKYNKIYKIHENLETPKKLNTKLLNEKENYHVKVETLVNNTQRSAPRKFSRTPISKSSDSR